MDSWQSGYVDTNGMRAHYTRTGGDKTPFVLVHGFTDDGLCWTAAAQRLAVDYDVVMPDARAHGLSSAPPAGYDALTQAEDLLGILQALELKMAFVLGHSRGAVTALALAARHPEAVRAMMLEDPPPWWTRNLPRDGITGEAKRDDGLKNWALQLHSHTRAELIASERQNNPHWTDTELEPWADSKLLFNPLMTASFFNGRSENEIDWTELLPQVGCPTLVLTGDPQKGAILKPTDVAELQALIPQMQMVHIQGAGHSIRRDQFEMYMSAVTDFISGTARSL